MTGVQTCALPIFIGVRVRSRVIVRAARNQRDDVVNHNEAETPAVVEKVVVPSPPKPQVTDLAVKQPAEQIQPAIPVKGL